MKKISKKFFKPIGITLVVAVFVLLVNLVDAGIYPRFLKQPLNDLNTTTGNLLFRAQQQTDGLSIYYIDVGMGDSELISCEGQNMLIDAGTPEEGKTVAQLLKQTGIEKLDYVVVTHPHNDHIGGMSEILDQFQVDEVLIPDSITTSESYKDFLLKVEDKKLKLTEPEQGYEGILGSSKFTVLSADKDYSNLNNSSIVLKLTYKTKSFLFTGDAEQESEQIMISSGQNLSADVLKVGHHGSVTSTSDEFLRKVNPSYAIISVGAGNSYGLPDTEILKRLDQYNIQVFRTDLNGTITLRSDGKNIEIEKRKQIGNIE